MKTLNEIVEHFKIFEPQIKDNYVEINLPIILNITHNCITFRIFPNKNGYTISDGGYTFENCNNSASFYFSPFAQKHDKLCQSFTLNENEEITKTYSENDSLTTALDEFIKLLIKLDETI